IEPPAAMDKKGQGAQTKAPALHGRAPRHHLRADNDQHRDDQPHETGIACIDDAQRLPGLARQLGIVQEIQYLVHWPSLSINTTNSVSIRQLAFAIQYWNTESGKNARAAVGSRNPSDGTLVMWQVFVNLTGLLVVFLAVLAVVRQVDVRLA